MIVKNKFGVFWADTTDNCKSRSAYSRHGVAVIRQPLYNFRKCRALCSHVRSFTPEVKTCRNLY